MSLPMRGMHRLLLRNLEGGQTLTQLGQGSQRHASTMPVEKEGKVLHPDLLNQQVSAYSCTTGWEVYAACLSVRTSLQRCPGCDGLQVRETQYAVRGELYLRAEQLRKEGKEIIFTNVGNPHALGAKPLSFIRQVLSLCAAPFLLERPDVTSIFAPDAVARAKKLINAFKVRMHE
eukprot:1158164-Pelagomonas_calceolata.AAC.1